MAAADNEAGMRVSIRVSDGKDGLLHNILSGLNAEDRASRLKHLAYVGAVLEGAGRFNVAVRSGAPESEASASSEGAVQPAVTERSGVPARKKAAKNKSADQNGLRHPLNGEESAGDGTKFEEPDGLELGHLF